MVAARGLPLRVLLLAVLVAGGVFGARAVAGGSEVGISGDAVVGSTLTITYGGSEEVVGYEWQRCSPPLPCADASPDDPEWVAIPGATTRRYTPTDADVGAYLRGLVHTAGSTALRTSAHRGVFGATYASPRVGPVQPAPPPPPPGELPPPVAHQTANLEPISGEVFVKLPGETAFRPLREAEQVPLGSIVDATNGEVKVTTANEAGAIQDGWFWAGAFRLDQTNGAKPVTEMRLAGPFANGAARADVAERQRRGGRRLWGRGRCRCRTEGRNSSGTVRGTKWLTIDRRNRTITKVKRGRVAVRDFRTGRTVVVKAGDRYVARAGGARD